MDGTLYYIHSDLLGSTVAVSDAAGGEVGRVQYDPYGQVITSTLPVTLTDRLFTGQRLDSSTGLYYYNARYYDPHLGRFIQPDTLVPDPLNPQAWNRFSYVYNNPTSYIDPGGHIAWVPILIFGGAFLLGAGAGGYYAYHQGYGFESWQLYAYAGMGGLAGVVGAATGMWIEAALLPVGATVWQAAAVGAAGGFAAGVVEQSILETGGAAILGTEVSAERILLAGVTGGITGGLFAGASRWWRFRGIVPVNEGEITFRELKELAGGPEVALVRGRETRQLYLVKGGVGRASGRISRKLPEPFRLIAHTHPGGLAHGWPSNLDIAQLIECRQYSSIIVSEGGGVGYVVRHTRTGAEWLIGMIE